MNTIEQQSNINMRKFIEKHMQSGDRFYVINKKFFDQWLAYAKSGKSKNDWIMKIDNESLYNQKKKILNLKLDENIVIVPPRVWLAFTNWYGKSTEIRRRVISYPNTPLNNSNPNKNNIRVASRDQQTILELVIDLITIKVGVIQENGEKPEKSLQYVQISSKMTLLAVKELICKQFGLSVDPQNTQLWMKDEPIQPVVLQTLVEQNREIKDGMKFYIEQKMENSHWPTDEKLGKNKGKTSEAVAPSNRTVGCYNLGNTCYINSVIQCIANTAYFKEYFLSLNIQQEDGRFVDYSKHINIKNPLGFEGHIVKGFARLIDELYNSKFACLIEPKKFKSTMGRFKEEYNANQQQDAQELLVFLLDSLHEELNIRMKKPYIEQPNSAGRNEKELQIEYWSNFLQRNWSFFIFLFYGQMRSHLQCQQCKKSRLSYDVFSTLSLPLPESSQIRLNIVIQLLPQEIKNLLQNQSEDDQSVLKERLEIQRRKNTFNFQVHEMQLYQLTKERPILIQIAMNPSSQVYEITDYLIKQFPNLNLVAPVSPGKNLDIQFKSTEVMYYLMSEVNDSIHIVIPPDTYLNQIREGTYIQAVELLTQRGKQEIKDFYSLSSGNSPDKNALLNVNNHNTHQLQEEDNFKLVELTLEELDELIPAEEEVKIQCVKQSGVFSQASQDQPQGPQQQQDKNEIEENKEQILTDKEFFEMQRKEESKQLQPEFKTIQIQTEYYEYSKYQLTNQKNFNYNHFYQKVIKANNSGGKTQQQQPPLDQTIEYLPPQEYLIYFINRKLIQRDVYLTKANQYKTQLFGKPIFLFVNKETTTGREIYEEVWMRVRYMLNFTHVKYFENSQNFWWNQPSEQQKQFVPFVIKYAKNISSNQQSCSLCPAGFKCFGCLLKPSSEVKMYELLQEHSFFAIDWNIDFLNQYFQVQALKSLDYDEVNNAYQQLSQPENSQNDSKSKKVDLIDCLKMFESTEDIPIRDGLICEDCQTPTHHQRKISVSRAPPILIITLKRFKMVNNLKKKIDQDIHYPLYGLNLRDFMSEHSEQLVNTQYDLYAVINHIGEINSGHYTCTIKDEKTKNWYLYDDSYVKQLPETKVHSQFAYILFYRRRDLDNITLPQLYPSIKLTQTKRNQSTKQWFRGQPVRVKQQSGSNPLYGYIWDKRESDQVFHVKIGSMDLFTTIDMFETNEEYDDLTFLQSSRKSSSENGNEVSPPEEPKQQQSKKDKGKNGNSSKNGAKGGNDCLIF